MARKVKRIPQRSEFIIFTNGKESETNYFKALRASTRSIYDIKVVFSNGDPVNLVNKAILRKQSANQVWVVFDKDEFPDDAVNNAMRTARRNGIGVAFSNPSFEVWLIDHFVEYTQEKTAGELFAILDAFVKDSGYTNGYSKNDETMIEEVFMPRLMSAVHNADVSLQKRIVSYNQSRPNSTEIPYCKWNSCTTVHRLIAALKL